MSTSPIPISSPDAAPDARKVLQRLRSMLAGDIAAGLAQWQALDEQARLVLGSPVDAMAHDQAFQDFVAAWPTNAIDRRSRTIAVWCSLSPAERVEALAQVPAFLATLKAIGRTKVPCASTYLFEKRWRFMEPDAASQPQ